MVANFCLFCRKEFRSTAGLTLHRRRWCDAAKAARTSGGTSSSVPQTDQTDPLAESEVVDYGDNEDNDYWEFGK